MQKEIEDITGQEYKYGFTTDVQTDIIPRGLSEEVVRLISAKKNEPEWLLDFRLKAFRKWQSMTPPAWAHLNIPDIDFQAISYGGAKKNFAALLGGQAIASVGNPGDTAKYAVKALVVGSTERLAALPDVPTYAELGYDAKLDGIWMWRGYAVKAGTPEEMIAWFQDLCDKISEDPEWIEYMGEQLLAVRNDRTEAFTQIVEDEVVSTIEVLKSVEQISEDYER
jgi:hypothetical protein